MRELGACATVAVGTQQGSPASEKKLLRKWAVSGGVEGLCLPWKGEQKAKEKRQGRGVKGKGTPNSLGLNEAKKSRDWIGFPQTSSKISNATIPFRALK